MTDRSNNPLFRTSKISTPENQPYRRFGLRDNPFPDAPTISPFGSDPKQNGAIYAPELRVPEQQLFNLRLIPHIDQPDPRQIAFLMDYATKRGRGIGKTAFLQYQRRQIMRDLGDNLTEGAFVLMAAYILPDNNTRRFWQFIRHIAVSLNQCKCIAWALWRLRASSGLISEEVLGQVDINDPSGTLGNDKWLEENGISIEFDLSHHIERRLIDTGVDPEIALNLAVTGHDPEAFEKQFLRAKMDYWWRQNGERLVFDNFVRVFRAAGIDKTILLVDEVEKIVLPQNRDERRGFVDDIRRYFVDGPFQSVYTRFYSLLLTIHPAIQEIWTPHWNAAGLDRICPISGPTVEQHTLYFRPIHAEEHAKSLVLAYLNYFRDSENYRDQLYPFESSAIARALEVSKGIPGPMLKLLHLSMEQAVMENWATVTADRISNIYDASGIPSEPDSEDSPDRLPPPRIDLTAD